MKNSFLLYTEQRAIFNKLSDEQAGKLIKAIYEYVETGQIKEIDEMTNIIITPFITVLDKNDKKYEEVRKKRAEAGSKGGKQKVANLANAKSAKQKLANLADNDNVNVNDNKLNEFNLYNIYNNFSENKQCDCVSKFTKMRCSRKSTYNIDGKNYCNQHSKDILSELFKDNSNDTAKANKQEKHKYGEFKHVLLKDEELQALKRDYSNWEELIKYLDEYIEMKGYKAKSHYMAIRKWVVDAVKRNSAKISNVKTSNMSENRSYSSDDLEKFYDNI